MKIRLFLFLFIISLLSVEVSAQSVTITRKTITYTRKKPTFDFKKTFTISYPKIKAATPALSRKIEGVLSYESVLGLKLQEELDQYQWLSVADYKVKYNKNGVLCVKLWMEGSAAYYSSTEQVIVVDIRRANRIDPADVFINLEGLVTMLRKAQDSEKRDTLAFIRKKEPDADEPEILFGDRYFSSSDLVGYEVGAKGVTFHYDYNFPHVAIAYEPAGEFFYTWKQLKRYIKPDGLLARIAR